MVDVIFRIKHALYQIAYSFIHSVLAIYYRGKKQKVPPVKNPLLLKSACKLAEEIRDGTIKSEEVVQAYIERIAEVEPYVNAVVKDRFHEALEEAKEVDKKIHELTRSGIISKQQLADEKPFLGVPFTIKLLINVEGLPSTAASKVFKDQISSEDAPSVALVRKAGGIILAQTNAPEFGFSIECFNLLYGKTCNPYDTTRTPGASSGGESALLGAGASVVGLGNDMIGSLRLPAHFTGIFSHKPSEGLINKNGTFPIFHPDHAFLLYTGPMCRYSEDLIPLMKMLTEDNPVVHKFGQKVDFHKMKIYYSTSMKDPKMPPVDEKIVLSMHKAISHFVNNYEVKVKEVDISLMNKSSEVSLHFLSAPISNLIKFITLGKLQNINIPLDMLKLLFGKSTFSFPTLLFSAVISYPSLLLRRRNASTYYKEIRDQIKNKLDEFLDENSVFLYPTHSTVAPYHLEMSTSLTLSWAYTCIFNFTGHPVTQCPLGLNKEGLPYGMQIIGGLNNDQLTIACAVELEKVFGGWIPPK